MTLLKPAAQSTAHFEHPRVEESDIPVLGRTKKDDLMELVRPLFFPDGMNSFSLVHKFNSSTDIHGMQLIHDMIKCL